MESIGEDDFFRMNDVFSVWLMKRYKIHFEDLSTKEAKKKFKKFCKKWNKKKLDQIYYDPKRLLEENQTETYTKHEWNFKLTKEDQMKLKRATQQVYEGEKPTLPKPQPKVYGPTMPQKQQTQQK